MHSKLKLCIHNHPQGSGSDNIAVIFFAVVYTQSWEICAKEPD